MHADDSLPGEHVPGVPNIPGYILFQSAGLSLELLRSHLGDMMLAEEAKKTLVPQNCSHKRGSMQRRQGKRREEIFHNAQKTFELEGQLFLL